jgi:predicted nucleic acid-binding protein
MKPDQLPTSIVLDSEGLSRAATNDAAITRFLAFASLNRIRVILPTITITELLQDKPSDAAVWYVVNRLFIEDIDRDIAGKAGILRSRAERSRHKKRDLSVDSIIAAIAIRHAPSAVVTSDVADLSTLVSGHNVKVIHPDSAL